MSNNLEDKDLPKVSCCKCNKLLDYDEEEWWGHLVFCKSCGAEVLRDYSEYVAENKCSEEKV